MLAFLWALSNVPECSKEGSPSKDGTLFQVHAVAEQFSQCLIRLLPQLETVFIHAKRFYLFFVSLQNGSHGRMRQEAGRLMRQYS